MLQHHIRSIIFQADVIAVSTLYFVTFVAVHSNFVCMGYYISQGTYYNLHGHSWRNIRVHLSAYDPYKNKTCLARAGVVIDTSLSIMNYKNSTASFQHLALHEFLAILIVPADGIKFSARYLIGSWDLQSWNRILGPRKKRGSFWKQKALRTESFIIKQKANKAGWRPSASGNGIMWPLQEMLPDKASAGYGRPAAGP